MASFPLTHWSPSESLLRDVSKFSTEHVTNLCKNNTLVFLLCEFEELIVGDLSWPKDMHKCTRCVKALHLLQIVHSHSLAF